MNEISVNVEITASDGIHARPASELAKLAKNLGCEVVLRFNSKEAKASSIIGILALGLKRGSILEVFVRGDNCEHAVNEIVNFLKGLR